MTATSGRTSSPPFAYYNPNSQSWKTSQDTLLSDSQEYSPTLPKSGGMHNGQLFEHLTLGHHTTANAYSSLPTPHSQRQQTQRLTSRPAQEITRNNHLLEALAGASGSDIDFHTRARVGESWERIITWGIVVGRAWPFPTEEVVSYHDEDLWGRAFPIVKTQTNPEFIEWMIGLPEGWVTSPEIGLTRAQQLKAIGNGVVPQQALAALKILKERTVEVVDD